MSTLPTSPIGKQQLIDMKAGAILRENARKSERYLGCPIRLLLTFIVLIKSSLLCAWLVREYYHFNFRCSLLTSSLNDEMHRRRSIDDDEMSLHITDYTTANDSAREIDCVDEPINRLLKRSLSPQDGVTPYYQTKSAIEKKTDVVLTQSYVPTTVVTLTNTHLLSNDGDIIRMKTIRNRVKPMSDLEDDDDDLLDIDSDTPPRVYITKILSKGEETNGSEKQQTKKPKKQKSKQKKKKKFSRQTTTVPSAENGSTKVRKGKGVKRKHKKTNLEMNCTDTGEQTKSPRHLLTSLGLPYHTTPRPHQSSFLHGVIDPKDSSFTNKGQIRGYQMHIASRKPTPSTRLFEETRLLWEMNELNYTTHITALKTTMMTELERKHNQDTAANSVAHFVMPSTKQQSTTETPRNSFYASHTLSTWRLTPMSSTTSTTSNKMPNAKSPWLPKGVQTEAEKRLENGKIPMGQTYVRISTLEQLNNLQPTQPVTLHQAQTTPRPRPVKHGFDRSLDEAIDAGVLSYPPEKAEKEEKHTHATNDFLTHLATFSSSATCIARTIFDLWSASQLLALFQCLIGVCAAHRSLFVSHLVLDILLLVIGFIYTITMIVFSIVLYLLIGETPKQVLFKWILFALLLDAILLLYGCLVMISLRCCERIVQSRLSMRMEKHLLQAKPQSV